MADVSVYHVQSDERAQTEVETLGFDERILKICLNKQVPEATKKAKLDEFIQVRHQDTLDQGDCPVSQRNRRDRSSRTKPRASPTPSSPWQPTSVPSRDPSLRGPTAKRRRMIRRWSS